MAIHAHQDWDLAIVFNVITCPLTLRIQFPRLCGPSRDLNAHTLTVLRHSHATLNELLSLRCKSAHMVAALMIAIKRYELKQPTNPNSGNDADEEENFGRLLMRWPLQSTTTMYTEVYT